MAPREERKVYGAHWRKLRLAILDRDGWLCQIRSEGCEVQASHVDHIVSWRHGGAWYDPANLRAACATCNKSRGGRVGALETNGQRSRRPSREW